MKNKRGYIQDMLVYVVILFVLAIIVISGARLTKDYTEKYSNSSASAASKLILTKNADRFTSIFDYTFLTIFTLLIIGLFASVFLINTHPAFFFVMLILFAFMLIPFAILSNTFDTFSTNASVADVAVGFTFMTWLVSNWAFIFGVMGFLVMVVLFAKFKTAY